jgi:hypothetical protein
VKMEVASPSVPLKDAACFALKKSSSILLWQPQISQGYKQKLNSYKHKHINTHKLTFRIAVWRKYKAIFTSIIALELWYREIQCSVSPWNEPECAHITTEAMWINFLQHKSVYFLQSWTMA